MEFNPDNSYISVSALSTKRLKETGRFFDYFGTDNFTDMRNCIVSAFADGKASEEDKKLSFWLTTTIRGLGVAFRCSVGAGSPAGNKSYTVNILQILPIDEYETLNSEKKGLMLTNDLQNLHLKSKDLKVVRDRVTFLMKKTKNRIAGDGAYSYLADELETMQRVFIVIEAILNTEKDAVA